MPLSVLALTSGRMAIELMTLRERRLRVGRARGVDRVAGSDSFTVSASRETVCGMKAPLLRSTARDLSRLEL